MINAQSQATVVFRPQTWRAWFVLGLAGFLLTIWALVTIGVAMAPPPQAPGAQPAGAGPGVVLALILWPGALLCGHIGWGILRSRVAIREDELEFTLRRFAIWSPLQRVRHVRLPWSEVQGVQLVEQSNPYAPDGIQRDYVIHTSQGQFAVSNILWPQAAEIAQLVASRIGRVVGDLKAVADRVDVTQPRHRRGLKLMHGCGLAAMVLFAILLLLSGVAVLGGMPLTEFAKLATVCAIGLGGGAAMRRWSISS